MWLRDPTPDDQIYFIDELTERERRLLQPLVSDNNDPSLKYHGGKPTPVPASDSRVYRLAFFSKYIQAVIGLGPSRSWADCSNVFSIERAEKKIHRCLILTTRFTRWELIF